MTLLKNDIWKLFTGWGRRRVGMRQRLAAYSEKDRRVLLLTNEENHFTDEELYLALKEKAAMSKAGEM